MHTHHSSFPGALTAMLALLLLTSCSQTDRRAAAMLSDIAFREGVCDYVPLRTLRDSVLDTDADNFLIREAAEKGWQAFERETKMLSLMGTSLKLSRTWSEDGDRKRAAEALKDAERYGAEADRSTAEREAAQQTIRSLAANATGELIGWRFTHEYACTVDGKPARGRMVLVTDRRARTAVEYHDSGDEHAFELLAFIQYSLDD